jgi:hypothetical protein
LLPASISRFFLTTHHPGATALGTDELSLLMGDMRHFTHFDFAFPAKHTNSRFLILTPDITFKKS